MLTLDKIYHAAYVLKSVARKTDLIAAPGLNAESEIYLKTENLQVTGSFKVRGAYYKISQLTADEKAKGVIASSAGNHAQGVALAAQRSNIPSVICMPDGAPISKVEATKAYGAQVCLVKGAYDDAYDYACKLQKEKGYTYAQMAELSGVPLGTIQKIFSGETESPRYDTLLALEQIFTEQSVVCEAAASYKTDRKQAEMEVIRLMIIMPYQRTRELS